MRHQIVTAGFLFAATVCLAQIGVPSSRDIQLSARSTQAITVPPGTAAALIPFVVDPSTAGGDLFDVSVLDPGAVVTFLTPAAVEINAGNATGLGFFYVVTPAGAFNGTIIPSQFSSPGEHTILRLPANSPAGEYKVKINTQALSASTVALASYYSSSPVRAGVATAAQLYRVGESIGISGLLFNGAAPVTGATVVARIGDPTSAAVPVEVPLLDSGILDPIPSDGVYSGATPATTPGNYTVAIKAAGTANGLPFERLAATNVRVMQPLATFGTFTDAGVDANANGLFESLNITANITVQTAGNYQLGITLAASNGNQIKQNTSKLLAAGAQQMVLNFPANEVRSLLVNGPFSRLDAVLIYKDDPAFPLADKRDDAGMTQPYQISLFELGSLVFNGVNVITPIDLNANGKFDQLKIEAGVRVGVAGFYQWSGRLVDKLGREIDFVSGSANWNVGNNVATFVFDGRKIGQNAQNGPYFLRSVLLFGAGQSLVTEQILQTAAYPVTQFEGARCQGDLNNDGRVNAADLAIVQAAFGKRTGQPGFNPVADINQDGIVDIRDLTLVSQNIGCQI